MRAITWILALVAFVAGLGAQGATTSVNTIGMEFVRINPGTFTVGRFQPPYPKPGVVHNPSGGLYAEVLMTGDANGDLKLTRDEMRRVAETWFDGVDEQKSGTVTVEQFTQGFASMQPRARGGFGPARGGIGSGLAPGIFRLVDRNGDGAVTREEFVGAFGAWFDAWDAQRTGSLTSNQILKGLDATLASAAPAAAPGRGRGMPLTPEEFARIEADAKRDWSPGFQVAISRPYDIGKYEVTQGQWKRVMGTNPSIYQGTADPNDTDNYPVENVTWQDTQEFVRRLNAMEKTQVYRLPTEFEWEYAARAGADDDITWADIRVVGFIGGNLQPQPVGRMKPNAWGLYDTIGNVWEWVQDYYNEKLFADPVPPTSGTEHVLKGGGFIADVKNATYMTHAGGPGSKFDNGFRLVRTVP
jgi:sulfatase modifying factor 1